MFNVSIVCLFVSRIMFKSYVGKFYETYSKDQGKSESFVI